MRQIRQNTLILLCNLIVILPIQAQFFAGELCENGIDDDGDGLIDLNDPDCKCNGIKDSVFIPSSLIPNPSFELYKQCPDNLAQLDRSLNWIQASPATSDYFNLCGFKDDVFRGKPPQPLPAGRGYVGFLDIQNYPQRGIYKEYIGACLTSPMQAGKEYTLTYWVGFGSKGQVFGPRASLNMAIFGTSQCSNLPFAVNPAGYQCPTKYSGWFELTRVSVSGRNQWKKVVVKLRPTVNVEAVCLGPACAATDGEYYFWMDELILEETVKFDSLKIDISGNPCVDTVILKSSKSSVVSVNYQWYKDGIAIPGANFQNFAIPKGALGIYQLKVSYGKDCEVSKPYQYNIDQFITKFNPEICDGSFALIAGKMYSNPGLYYDTLSNSAGCDSILEINLLKHPSYTHYDRVEICEGDQYFFDGVNYDTTGSYTINYITVKGCDSILNFDLFVKKNSIHPIHVTKCNYSDIVVGGKRYSSAGFYTDTLQSSNSCDSILEIDITDIPTSETYIDTTMCKGSFFQVGSSMYTSSGNYIDTLISSLFCDSIVKLNLQIHPIDNQIMDSSICEGQSVSVYGKYYDKSGQYNCNGKNQFGCDSTILLNLIINKAYTVNFDSSICEGSFIEIANQRFDKTGNYKISLLSENSCDSTINLNLKINKNSIFNLDTLICSNQKIQIGSKVFDKTGDYTFNEKSYNHCDSLVHIKLSVLDPILIDGLVQNPKCFGESNGSIQVQVQGGVGSYQFIWNNADTARLIKDLKEGLYLLTVKDSIGCIASKSFDIVSPECFCFDVMTEDANCLPDSKTKIIIQNLSHISPVQYQLNGSVRMFTGNEIVGEKKGHYRLEIVDSAGCRFYKEFDLHFDNSFIRHIEPDTIYGVVGDSLDLIVPGILNNLFIHSQWNGRSVIACPNCLKTKVLAILGESTYVFEGEDENGCLYTYSVVIIAKQGFYVPNVFSPNGDLVNDYFNLISDSSIEKVDLLQIYSRWGEKVFESANGIPNTEFGSWDGYHNGQQVNPGVFVYLITFHDKAGVAHQLSGDVTLVR